MADIITLAAAQQGSTSISSISATARSPKSISHGDATA